MGDIEAMFHQVYIPESQRSFMRFLWWPGVDVYRGVEDYEMCVHSFGATHFFYRQLDFSSQPGVANEVLENEAESCLTVA